VPIPRRGPLASSYLAAVALVVCALVPFLLLTAALLPLLPLLAKSMKLSMSALNITVGLAEGGYAFGTVLAVQFAVRMPQRRMLLCYVSVFLVAAILAASAPVGIVFAVALIVMGLCTSLMLVAAVPALVIGWPTSKLPVTAVVLNLCIFGAVAIGPTVGSLQASGGSWRPLFWGVAAVAAMALLFALLTYVDVPPLASGVGWHVVAVPLAAVGCAASFYGAGQLQNVGLEPSALAPLLAGVAMLAALVVHQSLSRQPLMPIRQLATTFPVAGIVVALFASASAFTLTELVLVVLLKKTSPASIAVQFLPEFGAAVVTAVLFGLLIKTRFLPVLAIGGLCMVIAAAALLTGLATSGSALVAAAAGLIGLGVGASVSPALFLAAFSLRSSEIQRVFALLELLRGVTAFLVTPILLYLAMTIGISEKAGAETVTWIGLGIAAGGALIALALLTLGRERLQKPDLERWMKGQPAWESTPLLHLLRNRNQP
jgi:predicted MFS family arabinose efflux permease